MSNMKTHYWDEYHRIKDITTCGLQTIPYKQVRENHETVTCLRCIKLMPDRLRRWHDKHNKEWIEHAGIKKNFWASLFGM